VVAEIPAEANQRGRVEVDGCAGRRPAKRREFEKLQLNYNVTNLTGRQLGTICKFGQMLVMNGAGIPLMGYVKNFCSARSGAICKLIGHAFSANLLRSRVVGFGLFESIRIHGVETNEQEKVGLAPGPTTEPMADWGRERSIKRPRTLGCDRHFCVCFRHHNAIQAG
jgi:hypothetical protein